jgi:hypothetical protein
MSSELVQDETNLNTQVENSTNSSVGNVEDDLKKYGDKDYLDEDDMNGPPRYFLASLIDPSGVMNTDMRAFKIRKYKGKLEFASYEEADKAARELEKVDKYSHIFVGEGGKWMGWDPEGIKAEKEIFNDKDQQKIMEQLKVKEERMKHLNALVGKTKDNIKDKKKEFKQRKKDLIKDGMNDENTKEKPAAPETQEIELEEPERKPNHSGVDIKNRLRQKLQARQQAQSTENEGTKTDEEIKKDQKLNDMKRTLQQNQTTGTTLDENINRIQKLVAEARTKKLNNDLEKEMK